MSVLKNPAPEPKAPALPSKSMWIGVGAVALAVILLISGYVMAQRKSSEATKQAEAVNKRAEIDGLVEQIGRHLQVKGDETPLVAIVTDVDVARKQSPAFYQKAQNGDRLVVWSDKAVLYSPDKDEVESVLTFQVTPSPTTAALAAERATVEIRNGSGVAGLSTPVADKLRAQGLKVSKVTTAKVKQGYPTTLVMNTGSRALPASAQVLAEYGLAVSSSTVPGEAPVAADFLIILGKNDVAKYQK